LAYPERVPSRFHKKKPAQKLFRVLCGFLLRPKKDSLQLDLVSLYTILCEIARKIVHLQEELDKGGNDEL
jgi:hypothetical protein